jgi:FMN phosphatase YigB (HAD superfamily)
LLLFARDIMIEAVIFDLGHTIMDELQSREVVLRSRPIHLMPGVLETLPRISMRKGIWANTRRAKEAGIGHWLRRAKIDHYFSWIVTSAEAGYRKPDRRFFAYALAKCRLKKSRVLFVGNQLNTDIKGAAAYGIRNVWLSGEQYHSPDDSLTIEQIEPTYIISRLTDLPVLLSKLD